MNIKTIIKVAGAAYAAYNVAYGAWMVYSDRKSDKDLDVSKDDISYIIEEESAPGFKYVILKSNHGFKAATEALIHNGNIGGLCSLGTGIKKIFIFSDGIKKIAKERNLSYREAAMNTAYHECRHSWQFYYLEKLGIDSKRINKFNERFSYLDNPMEIDARKYADAKVAGREYRYSAKQFAYSIKQQMEAAGC